MHRTLFLICGTLLLCINAEDGIQDHPRRLKRQVNPGVALARDPGLWLKLKFAGLGMQVDRPHILVQSVRTKFAQARASQQVAAARREAAKLAGARAFVQKAQVAQNRVVGVQAAIARSSHAEAVRRVGAARRASVAFAAARNDIAARMAARRRSISGSNNNGKRRVFSQGKTRSSCASCLLKRGRLPNCQISCKVFQTKMNALFGKTNFARRRSDTK